MAVASSGMQEVPEIPVVRVSEEELYEYLNRAGLNIDFASTVFEEQYSKGVNYQSASGNADTSTSATGGTGNSMHFGDNSIVNIVEALNTKDGMVIIGVNIPKIMKKRPEKETPEQEPKQESGLDEKGE